MLRLLGRKTLVAGGAGFIGSHLCDRLLDAGASVICLDNLSTGSMANIAHLLSDSRFRFVEHDVTQPVDLEVDEIFNLACPASPVQYQKDPIATMQTSVLGAINLLKLAKDRDCRIFQASTSEVYGDPDQHPQSEAYWGHVNPIGTRACYDEGKRAAETLFFDHHRVHGVDIRVARIFNTYGPRMALDDGRVVSNFIVQALAGEPITVFGDGSQTRSFCYVDDLVGGILAMMDAGPDARGPINLGSTFEMTVAEIADLVIGLTGSSSPLIQCEMPQDDPRRRRPDLSLARDVLGWAPETSVEAGLAQTINYFRGVAEAARLSAPA